MRSLGLAKRFLALATLLTIITITLIVHLAHAQGNLFNTLTSNRNTSRSITLLIRDSQDQITLVGISVPALDPGGLVLGAADSTDSGVNVAGGYLGGDHVVLVAGFGVLGPASVLANYLELRSTVFRR